MDFGGECKRISYAASFGGLYTSDIPNHVYKKIALYLKRFDVISVREPGGIDICRKAGREDVICVPDPTLLLSQTDYMEISQPFELPDRRYLFIYFLWEKSSEDMKEIFHFANENNLNVVYVASQCKLDRYLKYYPTIEQWLFLVKNAEYVVTDSFHATVFSIKMNRKFYTMLSHKRNDERIYTLLERYGLKNRCGALSSSLPSLSILKEEIDYESINEILCNDRNLVETWMKQNLTAS